MEGTELDIHVCTKYFGEATNAIAVLSKIKRGPLEETRQTGKDHPNSANEKK